MSYTHRPARDSDIPELVSMLAEAELHDSGDVDTTTEVLRQQFGDTRFSHERDTLVLLDADEQICGFGWARDKDPGVLVQSYGSVRVGYRGRGLGTAIVAWAIERAGDARLQFVIEGRNADAAAMVRANGFTFARRFTRMKISLDRSAPVVEAPSGIDVVPFAMEDVDDVIAVLDTAFLDHWEYVPLPRDEWIVNYLQSEGADPSLWWVARADGAIVGALIARVYEEDQEGWVRTLGVAREARKRGVGSALLSRSFSQMRSRGLARAALMVDSDSPTGAVGVYERAGMTGGYVLDYYDRASR
jgi:mycothiol synthase